MGQDARSGNADEALRIIDEWAEIAKSSAVSQRRYKEVGKHVIQTVIRDSNLRQKDVARELGVSATYFSGMLNGHHPIQDRHILKIRSMFPPRK